MLVGSSPCVSHLFCATTTLLGGIGAERQTVVCMCGNRPAANENQTDQSLQVFCCEIACSMCLRNLPPAPTTLASFGVSLFFLYFGAVLSARAERRWSLVAPRRVSRRRKSKDTQTAVLINIILRSDSSQLNRSYVGAQHCKA